MKLPASLQSILWSADIKQLDLTKDKIYIINQILSYGGLKELRWLFSNYDTSEIKNVFVQFPIKTYRPATFNFISKIILDLEEDLPVNRYVINTPRNIG